MHQTEPKQSEFINVQMLQRQIMFKQLQELQRRQQLQELGNTRNPNYANQLSSLKQASGGQFSNIDNGTFIVGNMQMMQHGGPSVFTQSHNDALGPMGLSQPQFDVSLYGTHAPNSNKHLSQYSYLQGQSSLSVNPLTKNSNSPLGMTGMQPSGFSSSFMNQQRNFSSDHISMPDGSFLSNQEKNLFGQVPIEGFNSGNLPSNYYSQQGITMQRNALHLESEGRHEDASWHEISPRKTSNIGLSETAASLDPLEQKILYNTDDNSWVSSFGSSKMCTGGFESSTVEHTSDGDAMPSLQSGSWSALMQSAVAETSSNDHSIQEEWSGLSFQNPEPLSDNKPMNFMDSEKMQNNWVDRNVQIACSPSSRPEQLFQNFNMNCDFQQLGHQYPKEEEYHSESSHATTRHSPRNTSQLSGYNSQQKGPTRGRHLIQTSLPPTNIGPSQHKEHSNNDAHQPSIFSCNNDNQSGNNISGHEFRGTSWLQGSGTLHHVPRGNQKPHDQLNHLNIHEYAVESEILAPGENMEAVPTLLGASLQHNPEIVTAPSESMLELLNEDDISIEPMPAVQLNSKLSIPGRLPLFETSAKTHNTSPASPHFGYKLGPADPQTPQSYSFIPSSSMGTSSAASLSSHNMNDYIKNKGPNPTVPSDVATRFPAYSAAASQDNSQRKRSSPSEGFTGINNLASPSSSSHNQEFVRKHHLESDDVGSGLLMTNTHQQPSNQSEGRVNDTPSFPSRDDGVVHHSHSSSQNYSLLQQVKMARNSETDGGKSFPPKYENADNQQSISSARELLLSGQKSHHQNLHQMNKLFPNDTQSQFLGGNEASNLTYQSQISLQMAPSWFKRYGTLMNGQMLPMYDPRAAINAAQPLPEMTLAKLQENSLIMQVHLTNASQGSGLCPSTTATSIACKQLNPTPVSPSDVTCQNLSVSIPKKRKLVALETVPWHKEVNHKQSALQDISTAELVWAEASNRRPEEVKGEAESVEELLPLIRAKRRLICSTQLMQQVFRPAPAVILWSDANSNCDYVAYSAARLALGDACSLTCRQSFDAADVSPDGLKSSKRTNSSEFSKVVERCIVRAKKLEGDLARLDKSLTFIDIKVEAQELEKFSIINRFAKFHIKAHPSTVDPASSSGTPTLNRTNLQRYVTAVPMPRIVPEGTDCLSL